MAMERSEDEGPSASDEEARTADEERCDAMMKQLRRAGGAALLVNVSSTHTHIHSSVHYRGMKRRGAGLGSPLLAPPPLPLFLRAREQRIDQKWVRHEGKENSK